MRRGEGRREKRMEEGLGKREKRMGEGRRWWGRGEEKGEERRKKGKERERSCGKTLRHQTQKANEQRVFLNLPNPPKYQLNISE